MPSVGFVDSLEGSASSTLFSVQSQVSVLRLGQWQEALGVLVGVDRDAGVIAFQSFKIIVPPRELEYLRDLEALTGNRVGILRTDEPSRPLLARPAEPAATTTGEAPRSDAPARQRRGSTQGGHRP